MAKYLVTTVIDGKVQQKVVEATNRKSAAGRAFPFLKVTQKYGKRITVEEFFRELLAQAEEPAMIRVPLLEGWGMKVFCEEGMTAYVFSFLPLFPYGFLLPDGGYIVIFGKKLGVLVIAGPFPPHRHFKGAERIEEVPRK